MVHAAIAALFELREEELLEQECLAFLGDLLQSRGYSKSKNLQANDLRFVKEKLVQDEDGSLLVRQRLQMRERTRIEVGISENIVRHNAKFS